MGALTSKLYAYKARPWELLSHATVSIQDPFLPKIYIESRDNKILRILPLIGTEEWIQDSTRFFISINKLKHPTIVFKLNFNYNIENTKIFSIKKISNSCPTTELLYKLSDNIQSTSNLTIILDKLTDAKTINLLRLLNKHKNHINIKLVNGFVTSNDKTFLGSLESVQYPDVFLKQNKNFQDLLHSKLINYKYSLSNNTSIMVNFYETLYLAEGRYLFEQNNNSMSIAVNSSFAPFFLFIKNKLILDAVLHALPFNKQEALCFYNPKLNTIAIDLKSVHFDFGQNFAFTDSVKSLHNIKYVFATKNFFNHSLSFINLFGEVIRTTPVFPVSFSQDNLLVLLNLSLTMSSVLNYGKTFSNVIKLMVPKIFLEKL